MSIRQLSKVLISVLLLASAYAMSTKPQIGAFRKNGEVFACLKSTGIAIKINYDFLRNKECTRFVDGISNLQAAEEVVNAQSWDACYNSFYDGSQFIVYLDTRGSYLASIYSCINPEDVSRYEWKPTAQTFIQKLIQNFN